MPQEAGTYVSDFDANNPVSGDGVSGGDDHIRFMKTVLKSTFPNATKAFRFPAGVLEATGTVTVVFPTDLNKMFPVSAAGAARTVNLPDPTAGGTVNEDGFSLIVIKTDDSLNVVTIDANASQTINGALTLVLNRQYQFAILVWNKLDAEWYAYVGGGGNTVQAALAKTANYALVASDHERTINCDVSGGAFTITLPSTLVAGFKARIRRISATSATALTLSAAANINGVATLRMFGLHDVYEIEWDGATWWGTLRGLEVERIGTVREWPLMTVPSAKWLSLHTAAQTVDRTVYAELFALTGTIFGVGNGTTTFGIQNRAGYFPRAWNNASGIDPDAAARTDRGDTTVGDVVGSKQEDALDTHTHDFSWTPTVLDTDTPNIGAATDFAPDLSLANDETTGGVTAGTADVSTETRPKNISAFYTMKALP